jgi:hypothetical protein
MMGTSRPNILDMSDLQMTGEITDKIYKNGVLIEERTGHNLVVKSFLKLVMALCKGQSGYGGIQYWAIGSGADSWDTTTPEPEINATRLTNEFSRTPILPSEITFVDENGIESVVPTGILQIKHTFGTDECNGKWREFGIFGGNATGELNSGIMINKKHHNIITKTSDMSIERTMKFTLNLSAKEV